MYMMCVLGGDKHYSTGLMSFLTSGTQVKCPYMVVMKDNGWIHVISSLEELD